MSKLAVTGPTMSCAKDIITPEEAVGSQLGTTEQRGDGRGSVLSWKRQAMFWFDQQAYLLCPLYLVSLLTSASPHSWSVCSPMTEGGVTVLYDAAGVSRWEAGSLTVAPRLFPHIC